MTHTPKSLLVTGAAGFIGSNIVNYWLAQHPEEKIIALDALTYAGNRANLESAEAHPHFKFVHGDILDTSLIESILEEDQVDTIIHFAAETHVDRSIDGPDAFLKTNIEGTHSLLKAAKKVWLDEGEKTHRFHHVSTDEVYGSLTIDAAAFTEQNQYQPNSPYAASKASSDHLVRSYHHTYGLEVTTSNCSNNYGPNQFPEKLIPLFIINALNGKPLPIYGDGKQIRDWLHVEDHCRGIELIVKEGRGGQVYNIGGSCERENINIIDFLCSELDAIFENDHEISTRFPKSPAANGQSISILKSFVEDRVGHDRRYAVDTSKIKSELGFSPVHTFESGFSHTVKWYLNNEEWWRSVMDGSYRDWIKNQYG